MKSFYLVPIGVLGIIRWVSWLLRRIPAVLYKPMSTGHRESLAIVVPVYQEDPAIFRRALDSWLANDVDEIICVVDFTDQVCLDIARSCPAPVQVIVTDVPGKRDALRKGWEAARSSLVALVDSDTLWAGDVARLVCEPFADPTIGGVGTRQSVLNPRGLWQTIADLYLDYRYFDEIAGQTVMGRAVSCLSGRTAVYRRHLLVAHTERFMDEKFLGVPCMSGDDKRLTCLTLEAGYHTFLQRTARVWSLFPDRAGKFFRQRTRWARNTWRSDLRALSSRWVWGHPFLAFCMADKAVASFTLLVSASFMVFALVGQRWVLAAILGAWWFVSRSAKMLPHLERRPRDILLMPAFILVSISMAVVKMWALLTVRKQLWLTRDVAVVDGEVVRTGAMAGASHPEPVLALVRIPEVVTVPAPAHRDLSTNGSDGHAPVPQRTATAGSVPVVDAVPADGNGTETSVPSVLGSLAMTTSGAGSNGAVKAPPEVDMERWGSDGGGRRKVVRSGPTTVALLLDPVDQHAGDESRVGVEVRFAGGMKSIRVDYGDGSSFDGVRLPEWYCNGRMDPKTTSAGASHAYSEPGTYTVTAVVTTVDCSGEDAPRLPSGWTRPTRRDGSPARPDPLFPKFGPVGNEQVTTVSITTIVRAAPPPPADRPSASAVTRSATTGHHDN